MIILTNDFFIGHLTVDGHAKYNMDDAVSDQVDMKYHLKDPHMYICEEWHS